MTRFTRIRETLCPYSGFLIGAVVAVPTEPLGFALLVTLIHEHGHVVAAFITGGQGAWDVQRSNDLQLWFSEHVPATVSAAGLRCALLPMGPRFYVSLYALGLMPVSFRKSLQK